MPDMQDTTLAVPLLIIAMVGLRFRLTGVMVALVGFLLLFDMLSGVIGDEAASTGRGLILAGLALLLSRHGASCLWQQLARTILALRLGEYRWQRSRTKPTLS